MNSLLTTWRLAAHERKEIKADPVLIAAALEMPELLRVEGSHGGRVWLRTRGVVGAILRGPLRVVVSPRHLSRAVALGLVLGGRGLKMQNLPGELAEDDDLLRVLALTFLGECARLFQRGLRREYRDLSTRPDPLRGELDLDRWHGPRSPDGGAHPWCRVRTRSADLPEHRLLHAALGSLARAEVLEGPLRQRAASLAGRLDDVPATLPSRSSWARLRRTGLFAPYALPLSLAEILLDGLLGEGDQGRQGRGFLLDLDKLFEQWLATELGRLAPPDWRVDAQEQVSIAMPRLQRALDVSIRDGQGHRVAILDAKNKGFDEGVPPRSDVHQLITYMATLQCPVGALVGIEAGGAPLAGEYALKGGVGRLHVARLPGRGTIDDLLAGLVVWSRALGPEWATLADSSGDRTLPAIDRGCESPGGEG